MKNTNSPLSPFVKKAIQYGLITAVFMASYELVLHFAGLDLREGAGFAKYLIPKHVDNFPYYEFL